MTRAEEIYTALYKLDLLAVCKECLDGDDEDHRVNPETGECYRHGGWSPKAIKQRIAELLDSGILR